MWCVRAGNSILKPSRRPSSFPLVLRKKWRRCVGVEEGGGVVDSSSSIVSIEAKILKKKEKLAVQFSRKFDGVLFFFFPFFGSKLEGSRGHHSHSWRIWRPLEAVLPYNFQRGAAAAY